MAQAIPLACSGLVPAAVVILVTRATALDTLTPGAMCSVCIFDGTNTRLATSMSEDGQLAASADTGLDYDNATNVIRVLDTASEATDGLASGTLAADVLNLSWTDLPSTAVQIQVWAFYGPRVQARVGAIAASTTANATVSVTGLPFRPVALIHLGARGGFTQSGANADMHLGLVAFNPDGTVQGEGGYAMRDFDRLALTTNASEIRDDSTGARITGIAEEERYSVTAGTADGFDLTTGANGGIPYAFGYLALFTEGRAAVGVIQLPGTSQSTGNKTVSGLGFHSGAVFFIGTNLVAKNPATPDNINPCCNWSFGAFIPGVGSSSIGYGCEDAAATSRTNAATSAVTCIGIPDAADGTDWAAVGVSAAYDEFVVNVTVASPLDRYLVYLALEERKAMRSRRWRTLGRGAQAMRAVTKHVLSRAATRGASYHLKAVARVTRPPARAPRVLTPLGRRQVNNKGMWVRILRFWERQRRGMLDRLFIRKRPRRPPPTPERLHGTPKGSNAYAGSLLGEDAGAGSRKGSTL